MKKILIFVTTFALILSIYSNFSANAEEKDNSQNAAKLSVEKNNDELIATVNIIGNENGILGMQGTLVYDKEKMELVSKECLNENFDITAFSEEKGIFLIEIDTESFFEQERYIYDSQDIIKFTFKVKEKSDFSIEDIKLVDGKYDTIEVDDVKYSSSFNFKIIIAGITVILIIILVFSKKKK